MPDYVTQTQTKTYRKAGTYMGYAERFLRNKRNLSKVFFEFKNSMNKLMADMKELYTANENGICLQLSTVIQDPEDGSKDITRFDLLKRQYQVCHENALRMLEKCVESGISKDSVAYRSIEAIVKFLSQDRNMLLRYDDTFQMSLAEFVASHHTNYVDLTERKIRKEGGNASTRLPIRVKIKAPDGEAWISTGMFTEEVKSNQDKTVQMLVDIINEARTTGKDGTHIEALYRLSGQNLNALMDALGHLNVERNKDGEVSGVNMETGGIDTYAARALDAMARDYFLNLKEPDTKQKLDAIISVAEKVRSSYYAQRLRNAARIPYGSNINRRNEAMTAVADLLKVSDLVAKSVPMTVKTKDGIKKGTFMEFANGSDLAHLSIGDNLLNADPKHFLKTNENKGGVIAASDLQVLDFICGNVDRHKGNIFYQVSKEGYFLGLQGIDNDLSFGILSDDILTGARPLQSFVSLRDMRFVSREMAKQINTLTPEMLSTMISGYGFTPQETEAACHRLKVLKEALNYKYIKNEKAFDHKEFEEDDSGELYVLDSSQIATLDISGLARKGRRSVDNEKVGKNIFGHIDLIYKKIADYKKKGKTGSLLDGKLNNEQRARRFPKLAQQSKNQKPDFEKYAIRLAKHYREIKLANKGMFSSSTEYKNVLSYLDYMIAELNYMKGKEDDDQMLERVYRMFENMYALDTMYLDHKMTDGSLDSNRRSQDRMMAVTGLQEVVSNYVGRFGLDNQAQYRYLNQNQRLGTFDRKHDPESLQAAIRELHEEQKHREENSENRVIANINNDIYMAELIDGISTKSWMKTVEAYMQTADNLIDRIKEPLYISEELDDAVRQYRDFVRTCRQGGEGYLRELGGQNIFSSLKQNLKSISGAALSVLNKVYGESGNLKDIRMICTLHSLADLGESAGKNEAVPDLTGQIAGELLVRSASAGSANILTGENAREVYTNALERIKNNRAFKELTEEKNEKQLRKVLNSDKTLNSTARRIGNVVRKISSPKAVFTRTLSEIIKN